MYRDTIFQYVKKQYGTIPEYLWNDLPDSAILCSVVKRVDTFLNTIFRKDRITPGFPCRTPLFHLVYNHQAKSEGV